MKIKISYIIILLVTNLLGQSSVHLQDKLSHGKQLKHNSNKHITITKGTNTLTKTVFGFLPYWEISSANLRLDLLSHIALFDFVVNEDGSLTPPYNWPDSMATIINSAQSSKVKVIATISNLTDEAVDSVLVSNLINNESVKKTFFSDVHSLIASYNLDGINLDFENPKLSERGDPINNFTQELRDSLDTWFTNKELSFATPAVNWGNRWKLKELSEICDYLFIMAYDYHGSWSPNAGPVAPLTGDSTHNIKNYESTIGVDYAGIDPSKLILGVPYYGSRWQTNNSDPYTNVTPYGKPESNWIENPSYRDINWSEQGNSFVLDNISYSPFLLTQTGNTYILTWIDNEYSLSLKYDFAIEKNLGGVGFWSLGKDGNYPELWNLIKEKFADTTTGVKGKNLVNNLILYQNYPNPFNPTTTIKFGLPESGFVELTVYNILGQKVAQLVNEQLQAGYHEISFGSNNLSSGMYIYRINVGDKFNSIKKMLMVK